MLRLAHISDIHLTTAPLGWRRGDWFNKRLAAWANLRLLGRGYRFRHADTVITQLMKELSDRGVDHIVFSGDATALGFEGEVEKAARMLGVGIAPGIAVPGNHDYCTISAAGSESFEKHFIAWQQGERIGEHFYPFAQRVGPAWLIAVNSATGNRWPWDAGGAVGPEQRERLRQLLARLDGGPRILVTHFPICLANGQREARSHGLRDVHEVVQVAMEGGLDLWLHGHRHQPYFFEKAPLAPFAVVCGGSATQTGIWSYFEYAIDGNQLQATRRVFNLESQRFEDGVGFALELSAGAKPIV